MKHVVSRVVAALMVTSALVTPLAAVAATDFVARATDDFNKNDTKGALIELSNALQANRDDAKARLLRGIILTQYGDYSLAEQDLRAAAAQLPPSDWYEALLTCLLGSQKYPDIKDLVAKTAPADAHLKAVGTSFLGDVALANKDNAGAVANYKAALDLDPAFVNAIVGQVRVAMARNQLDQADALLKKAVSLQPKNPEVLLASIDLAAAHHDTQASGAAIDALIAERPHNPYYQMILAGYQVANGKDADAAATLDKVDAVLKNSPGSTHLRAVLALHKGDAATADALETKVLAVNPSYQEAVYIDGLAKYALGQYSEAEKMLDGVKGGGIDPDLAAFTRGQALMQLGRPADSYAVLAPLAPKMGTQFNYLALAGAAARESGNLAVAKDYFTKALAQKPDATDVMVDLGGTLIDGGETAKGLDLIRQAHAKAPQDERITGALFAASLQAKDFDGAQKIAQETLTASPTKPTGLVMQGMVAFSSGHVEDAAASFQKALDLQPDDEDAALNLGNADLSLKKLDAAAAVADDAFKRHPQSMAIMDLGARVAETAGDATAQQTWLERAIAVDPKQIYARSRLIHLLIDTHQGDKAVTVALEGLQALPNNPETLLNLGQAYVATGQFDKAEHPLTDLMAQSPGPLVYSLMVSTYIGLKDKPNLITTLQAWIKAKPDDLGPQLELGTVYLDDKARWPDAAALVGTLEKAHPDDPRVIELAVRQETVTKGPAAGLALLKSKADSANPPSRPLTFLLANAYSDQGQRPAAIDTMKTWVSNNPHDLLAALRLAEFYMLDKQFPSAVAILNPLVEAAPKNGIVQNDLAWSLLNSGDLAGAQAHATAARMLNPNDPNVLDTAGEIAKASGDTKGALTLLQQAVKTRNPSPTIRYHLAEVLALDGQKAAAHDALKALLADSTSFPEAAAAKTLFDQTE